MKQGWMIISLSAFFGMATTAHAEVRAFHDGDRALCDTEYSECRKVASLNYGHCNIMRGSGCRETLINDILVCNENFQECLEEVGGFTNNFF